jgi:hypothetical protein
VHTSLIIWIITRIIIIGGGGGKSRDDKERRIETPPLDAVIIIINEKSGLAYIKNDLNPIFYSSLETLFISEYSNYISKDHFCEIERYHQLSKNKNTPFEKNLNLSMDNQLRLFELQILPNIDVSTVLILKEIQSKLDGKEIELLKEGHLSNDYKRILIYVNLQNKKGYNPTHGELCDYMGFTSRTFRNKKNALIQYNYLIEEKIGRTKNLIITEKGKKSIM